MSVYVLGRSIVECPRWARNYLNHSSFQTVFFFTEALSQSAWTLGWPFLHLIYQILAPLARYIVFWCADSENRIRFAIFWEFEMAQPCRSLPPPLFLHVLLSCSRTEACLFTYGVTICNWIRCVSFDTSREVHTTLCKPQTALGSRSRKSRSAPGGA